MTQNECLEMYQEEEQELQLENEIESELDDDLEEEEDEEESGKTNKSLIILGLFFTKRVDFVFRVQRAEMQVDQLHPDLWRPEGAGAAHRAFPRDGGAQGLLRVRLPLEKLPPLLQTLQRQIQTAHPHAGPLGRETKQVHGENPENI